MPGTSQPVGVSGPGIPPFWTALFQAIQSHGTQLLALTSARNQGSLIDQYGNTVEVASTNLNQVVTAGASYGQAGVQIGTGKANGTAGRVKQSALATGTITTTKGSTTAQLISTISGTFTGGSGQPVIGAADVSDPATGVATPAITPGTTFTISSGTITLSQPAAESGSAIFCAACLFS